MPSRPEELIKKYIVSTHQKEMLVGHYKRAHTNIRDTGHCYHFQHLLVLL